MTSVALARFSAHLHRYTFRSFVPLFLLMSLYSSGQSLSNTDYPIVWLRADSSGSLTGFWKDVSANGRNAMVFGQPVYLKSSLNYNPAFRFNGSNDSLSIPCNVDSLAAITVIAVLKPADTAETGVWGSVNATAHKMMMTTRRVTGPNGSIDSFGATGNFALVSTVIQNWRAGSLTSQNAYLLFGSSGQQNNIPPFNGTIAELLVFDRSLDVLTQIQFETYLAIKYGIPLTRGNYVSAGEMVLWNAEKNKDYSYRMTGLGREDFFSLHQKQSTSVMDPDSLLVISNGRFMFSNADNTGSIANGNYLIWGDNNKSPLTLSRTVDGQLQLINRQWLMNASGEHANTLNTTIQLNQRSVKAGHYWLVVNPGRSAGFPVDSLCYYLADSVTAKGLAVYNNVKWDTDRSGDDLFGFAVAKDLLLTMKVLDTPSCALTQAGSARLQAVGGQAPFTYAVTNSQGNIVTTGTLQNATADISILSAGTYRVVLKDSKGHQSFRTLLMPVPAAQRLRIGLEANRVLPSGGELMLDASRYINPGDAVAYRWKCENGFNATTPQVNIKQPGTYTVSVTSRAGCVFSDTVVVTGKAQQHIAVYPSPSIDGNFTISMSFPRATAVRVGVYDAKGNKVQEMSGSNNTEYRFTGHIITAGTYTISVVTRLGVESRTLVIL